MTDQGAVSEQVWSEAMQRIRDERSREDFARIFRHFAPRIKGFLMRSGVAGPEAEDIAQDVMITLWQKAHLFDPAKARLSTWIFTIARNRRVDRLRREMRPDPQTLDLGWGPEEAPSAETQLEAEQQRAALASALATLPEAQRVLIEQAYFAEQTQREVAALSDLPLGTVKSRIRLALDKLRTRIN